VSTTPQSETATDFMESLSPLSKKPSTEKRRATRRRSRP
jgi:hypothetical protein